VNGGLELGIESGLGDLVIYPVNLLLQKGVDSESLEEYRAVVHGMALFLMEDGTFSSSLE